MHRNLWFSFLRAFLWSTITEIFSIFLNVLFANSLQMCYWNNVIKMQMLMEKIIVKGRSFSFITYVAECVISENIRKTNKIISLKYFGTMYHSAIWELMLVTVISQKILGSYAIEFSTDWSVQFELICFKMFIPCLSCVCFQAVWSPIACLHVSVGNCEEQGCHPQTTSLLLSRVLVITSRKSITYLLKMHSVFKNEMHLKW